MPANHSYNQYNEYNSADNLQGCTDKCTQDFSKFANPECPEGNDVHFLYREIKMNVLNTQGESYKFDAFLRDLQFSIGFLQEEIIAETKCLTDFVRTTVIPVMVEEGQDDGEMGRYNQYPLPKDTAEIIRVEYDAGCCCFKEMKPIKHNQFNQSKCCKRGSEAYDMAFNKCKICFKCKDVYLKENNCIILPFKVTQYGELRLTYRQSAGFITKDTKNVNFPSRWYRVLAYFTALRYLNRHDGQKGGTHASTVEMYTLLYQQMIKAYKKGDENEVPVRWHDDLPIYQYK